jgi:hypothetical protein
MGYQRRHAIVVSGYEDGVLEAHGAAKRIFSDDPENGWQGQMVSPLVKSISNGEASFFVGPDGSNEGWNTSDEGDRRRAKFVGWLRHRSEESDYDRIFTADWVEVLFGDDEDRAEVVAHSRNGVYEDEESAD